MFLVVELCRPREVVVVPEAWTSGRQSSTLWPPYQSTVQLNKAVRSQEAPGEEWISHAIRTIHTADSYSKARRKMIQVGHHWSSGNGLVAVRRSERLKRAASQHSEAQENQPTPKRRRTNFTQPPRHTPALTDPPPPPPQPVWRSLRVRRPPPAPSPPPPQRQRIRRRHSQPPSTRRAQHPRPRPSPLTSRRMVVVLSHLHKSLNKQIQYLNVILRLLNALKKYVVLLPEILDRLMERVPSEQLPYMEMIPEIVVRVIIQFVQREAEVDSEDEEEEEEEESSVPREE